MNEFLLWVYLGLVLTGATLIVWLMMLISNDQFISEPKAIKDVRRTALAIMALGLLWGANYGFERQWTPWPPDIVMLVGLDLYLAVAIASAYRHIRPRSQKSFNR